MYQKQMEDKEKSYSNLSKSQSKYNIHNSYNDHNSESNMQANNTGIPDRLKNKIENTSGLTFDDVKVHYNSDKPSQVLSHAYTVGNQIYVAPGKEKYLKHELGHVAQQKLGMVKPQKTVSNMKVNSDKALENSPEKYLYTRYNDKNKEYQNDNQYTGVMQMMKYEHINELIKFLFQLQEDDDVENVMERIRGVIDDEPALLQAYNEIIEYLPRIDIVDDNNGPACEVVPRKKYWIFGEEYYRVKCFLYPADLLGDMDSLHEYISALFHEILHAICAFKYQHQEVATTQEAQYMKIANFREVVGISDAEQIDNIKSIMYQIMNTARKEYLTQHPNLSAYIEGRTQYAIDTHTYSHFDTVLFDMLYYMKSRPETNLNGKTYTLIQAYLNEANIRRNHPELPQLINLLPN